VRGIGGYELFDELLGNRLDNYPVHPWRSVHPEMVCFINFPGQQTDFLLTRLIRLMAEKYLIYSLGRIPTYALVSKDSFARIIAPPKSLLYSKISILTKLFTDITVLAEIPADAMFPTRKVNSVLIKIIPKEKPAIGDNFEIETFEYVIRQLMIRRQTELSKIVKSLGPNGEELLELSKLPGDLKCGEMTTEQFVRLANAFEKWEHKPIIDDTEFVLPALLAE